MSAGPLVSVVLCTYNRAERIEASVRAVLDQQGCDFELVVVDDGSTDATAKVLAALDHPRLRVVTQANGGLSVARNTGVAAARGDWIVFIDDDDVAEPGWLAGFVPALGDPTVALACCGSTAVDPSGTVLWTNHPRPLGEPFGDTVGSYLAGTFAVRAGVLAEAGGYLAGLGARHQTELFLRLLPVAARAGLRAASNDVCRLRIETKPAAARPVFDARRIYDATRWIVARHPVAFADQRVARARYEGVIGTAAARLGEWGSARRHFLRAARATPGSRSAWSRVALAAVPALGARVWNRHGGPDVPTGTSVGLVRQRPGDVRPGPPELYLAWGYRENPAPERSGPDGAAVGATRRTRPGRRRTGRRADRRLAERLARRRGWAPVVDVDGPAPAGSLPVRPGLVRCLDALHRVDDPVALLHRLAEVAAGGPVLLSTPDREAVDPDRPLGPPSTPDHRRHWSYDQLELLLLSTGFAVERTWRRGGRIVALVRAVTA